MDNDGLWNEEEMQEFQVNVLALAGVFSIIQILHDFLSGTML